MDTLARVAVVALVLVGVAGGVAYLATPDYDVGDGSATLTVRDSPANATLTEVGDGYRLDVPDAEVTLDSVVGRPVVVYRFDVPALGYRRGTAHFLREHHEGGFTLELESTVLDGEQVTREAYRAELAVLVRTDGDARTVHRRNVTLTVL